VTDGQTDRFANTVSRLCMHSLLTRDENTANTGIQSEIQIDIMCGQ